MRLLLAAIPLFFATVVEAQEVPPEETHCLAEAIYFEARNQPLLGQIAVAVVIKNRMKDPRWPSTACGVVHDGRYWKGNPVRDRCAFSYWCDGKSERPRETAAWTLALGIAKQVLTVDLTVEGLEEATHYHALSVTPRWSRTLDHCGTIGEHKFYD
jgi:spore germination cell wall hydrolase CwlJ-like protein